MSLWNQCLKLLSTNSTITNLSITHTCGGYKSECGIYHNENSLFNENFFNGLFKSLSNNKTIKTLTLNFNFPENWFPLKTDNNILYKINNNNIYNNNNNNNNKFKLVYNDLIKTIMVDYYEINNESINYINSLKSLETVIIGCLRSSGYLFTNSIWVLTYLNKLNNKDLIINFELDLDCCDPYQPKDLEIIEKEEFKFKTNEFKVSYDFEEETTYEFVYEMIKELNPKYLKIEPDQCVSDGGESHLLQYHSISKLNQNYESVEIINDFIPLYALYRFLQSPNLHTLKFDLQFHFLSSIYNNQIKDKTELDFNKMDNFKFINFGNYDYDEGQRFKVHDDIKFYIDNGINEDNQIYCSYSRSENECLSIPPYSMSLWNQCLKLLSTNSTITNLSITHNCGCICDFYSCGNGLFNENFFNDFMNSLANNKTIKTLTLDFNSQIYQSKCEYKEKNNINLINKSIPPMLDKNTTLESIVIIYYSIYHRNEIDLELSKEISNLTKNKKCKITIR
ncbi:hypothetical protein ACTFIZ_005960 [Dictyostelium cf. discoideum]